MQQRQRPTFASFATRNITTAVAATAVVAGLGFVLGASVLASRAAQAVPHPVSKASATSTGQSPKAPALLRYQHGNDVLQLRVRTSPAVVKAGQTATVVAEVGAVLKTRSASFGGRRPANGAVVDMVLLKPLPPSKSAGVAKSGKTVRAGEAGEAGVADKNKGATNPDETTAAADAEAEAEAAEAIRNRPKSPVLARRRALKLRDAGSFAATFTPTQAGIHTVQITATLEKVGTVTLAVPLPVEVWPLPAQVPLAQPRQGKRQPPLTTANLTHGKALCAAHCRRGVAGALPQNETPLFLASAQAAAASDSELLAKMVDLNTPEARRAIKAVGRHDLVAYLRTLHLQVRDFFPAAQAFTAQPFTINQYGLERLQDTVGLKLSPEEAAGVVFVVYQNAPNSDAEAETGTEAKAKTKDQSKTWTKRPMHIAYDNRVLRDGLSSKDKLGYLVFFGESALRPQTGEVGLALGREPTYPILAALARRKDGSLDAGTNRKLRTFVGKGKFNDPKSLRRGAPALQTKLIPLYLKAAELATMYYADERDFTAFDAEFN